MNLVFKGESWRWWILGALWAGLILLYAQSFAWSPLAYDDPAYLQENAAAELSIFHPPFWKEILTHSTANLWHPLTVLSHQALVRIPIDSINIHRIANVLLHGLCCSLWTLWIYREKRNLKVASLFAIILFLHPLTVEAVAWISGRKDLLCSFFMALCVLCHQSYRNETGQRFRYLSLFFAVAAMLSKPLGFLAPLLLLLVDLQAGHLHDGIVKQLKEKGALFLSSGALIMLTLFFQAQGTQSIPDGRSLFERLSGASWALLHSIESFAFPNSLHTAYADPLGISVLIPVAMGFGITGVLAVAFKLRKSHPVFLFGVLWTLVCLAPTLGLIRAGNHLAADRYFYLAIIGMAAMVAQIAGRWISLHGAVAAVLLVLSFSQISTWKSDTTLFQHAANLDAANSFSHSQLARIHAQNHQLASRDFHLKRALEINPTNAPANLQQANLFYENHQLNEAYNHYLAAAKVQSQEAWIEERLSAIAQKLGNRSKALTHLNLALAKARTEKEHRYLERAKRQLFPEQAEVIALY